MNIPQWLYGDNTDERIKFIKNCLIDDIGLKLGLDSSNKEIFKNFSNTLLRRMLEELNEKENI